VVSAHPSLAELEADFAESPQRVRKHLQFWKTEEHADFLAAAAQYLAGAPESAFAKLLIATLRGDGRSMQELLLKPAPLEADAALRVLSLAARSDPSYPVTLLGILRAEAEKSSGIYSPAELIRLIELLQAVVDENALVPVLIPLCGHASKQVRSKAVLLAANHGKRVDTRVDGLGDIDHRVRANAVEALWGESDPAAQQLFLNAAKDEHHRVAANALYGLYRAGNVAALQKIPAMLRQPDPNRQMAAAWVVGKTGDSRFLPCLEALLPVVSGRARSNLIHAARAIEARKRRLAAMPPLEMEAIRLERLEQGRIYCSFRAFGPGRTPIPASALGPTSVMVTDGEIRVDSVVLESRGSAHAAHVILLLPHRAGGDDPYAMRICEAAKAALEVKRPQDAWAILRYEPRWKSEEGGEALPDAFSPVFSTEANRLLAGPRPSGEILAPSFEAALAAAVGAFPDEVSYRCILALRDQALPALEGDAGFSSERLQKLAQSLNVSLHFLGTSPGEDPETRIWGELTRRLKGFALSKVPESELPAKLALLASACGGAFELSYALGRPGPAAQAPARFPIQVEAFTDFGYGKLLMED
jgi:HEAT repeat protein